MSNSKNSSKPQNNSVKSELDITRTPPWGKVTILEKGSYYCINRIEVNPGNHKNQEARHLGSALSPAV